MAWCGDSQMCLVKKSKLFYVSAPHKPHDEMEQKRIEAAGGAVLFHSGTWRVMGNISIARSFGDAGLEKYIISKPEIHYFDLDGDEDYLIIGIFLKYTEIKTLIFNSAILFLRL